jgi:hypothetical protein
MDDYFQSHTLSIVLTWLFSIPLIIALIGATINFIFEKIEGISRFYILWLVICILLFSPVRYILLQIFIAISYPFQSFRAFITIFILAVYIPIVFGILYAIGFALPMLGTYAIVGFKDTVSKVRLWLSALAAPIIFIIASYLFYLVLPYAAYSTHWLYTKDVIRATNGPPEYFYRYVVEPMALKIRFPMYVKEIGFDNLSPKERLRSHVAMVYLGEKQFTFFVYKSYPEEYKRKTGYVE